MSDGAVCIQPDVEQHAGIAISSCETFEALTGREARCAFLSFSTDGSGGLSEPVKKVREAVALAQQLRPDLKIDGEFSGRCRYRSSYRNNKKFKEIVKLRDVLMC